MCSHNQECIFQKRHIFELTTRLQRRPPAMNSWEKELQVFNTRKIIWLYRFLLQQQSPGFLCVSAMAINFLTWPHVSPESECFQSWGMLKKLRKGKTPETPPSDQKWTHTFAIRQLSSSPRMGFKRLLTGHLENTQPSSTHHAIQFLGVFYSLKI